MHARAQAFIIYERFGGGAADEETLPSNNGVYRSAWFSICGASIILFQDTILKVLKCISLPYIGTAVLWRT